jgi:gliding motility-associated-like protein
MKRIITIFCMFSISVLTAQSYTPEALNIILNKEVIKSDNYVDFVDKSKRILLPEDGMFLYSSLNNNGNYGFGYESNENYVVTISNPSNQKIRIRTEYIVLADDGDNLSFYDGPDTLHPLMVSYNGFVKKNELIVSHSNQITISFKSNGSGIDRGFRLRADQANMKGYNLASTTACINSTPAADACVNAPLICNLNGYCGNTSGQYTPDNTNIPGFCGSIENNSWLSFIASSPTAQFEFTSAGCQSTSSGIQALIYASSNCSNFTQVSNCVSQGSSSGSFTITTNTPLVVGTKYYIMVDGYGGNVCNYSVTAQSGVATNPQITANPTQICPGSSTQLGSSIVSTSYNWTASDGAVLPTTATISVSPTITTTYTLVVGPSVCSSVGGSAVQTITVTNTLTAPVISAPNGGCAGNAITLSSLTNGGTYSWTGPNGFTSTIQNPSINNFGTPEAGTYTLIISYGASCSTMPATVNINVLPSPTVNLSVSPSAAVCAGTSLILTASGASGSSGANPYNWNWNTAQATGTVQTCIANPLWISPFFEPVTGPQFFCADNPFPGANAGPTATIIPNQSTQICVSVTENGCTSQSCQNITILSNTTLSVSPSVTTCPAQPVTLTGYGASSYTWSPSADLSSANGASVSANPPTTTTYTVTGPGCGGTILTNTVEVAVNNIVPIIGSIQTPTLVCPNQTDVHYAVNNLAGTTYNWSLPPGAVITSTSSTINEVVANVSSVTGTFTVAVTASNTCGSTTESITIEVAQISVVASANPVSFCSPGSSTLTVSGAYWYDWQPTNGLSTTSGTTTTYVASPTVTTSYTVTGNQGACINSAVVTITVSSGGNSLSVSPSVTTCPTGSVTLIVNGGGSYTWSPASSILGSVNNSSVAANPSITTIYTVQGQGCSGTISNTIEVTVLNTLPVVAIGNPLALCAGGSSTLTASGADIYNWLPATGLSTSSGSITIATPTISSSYTVTGTIGTCSNTSVVNIVVTTTPVYTVTANPASICVGQTAILTATANGISSYTWNTGSTQNTVAVAPTTTTTYTVTDNSSCPGQGTITVIVNPVPVIFVNSATICSGKNATLTASGATSYTWNGVSTNLNPFIVSPTSTSIYTVIGTFTTGCSSTQTSTVNVNNPLASFSGMSNATESVETILTLKNTSTGASSIAWETCYGSISTSSVISLPLLDLGICCVKLYAFEGLCVDSTTKCVTVLPKSRLIVPNVFTPNNDAKNDVFTLDAVGIGEIAISVFDRWGLKMFESTASGNIRWDGKNKGGSTVADGTYFYILKATGLDGEIYDLKGTINVFQ